MYHIDLLKIDMFERILGCGITVYVRLRVIIKFV